MFWIALADAAAATQFTAPAPTNLGNWFKPDDLPNYLSNDGTWAVGVAIEIDQIGKVRRCNVENSSNIADLDRRTCDIVKKRAKFSPAVGLDGLPAPGIYRTSIGWLVTSSAGSVPMVRAINYQLFVNQLPQGTNGPVIVRVMFAVDAAGKITSCASEPGPHLEKTTQDPSLVALACDELSHGVTAVPMKDASGRVVASVQDAMVEFRADKP